MTQFASLAKQYQSAGHAATMIRAKQEMDNFYSRNISMRKPWSELKLADPRGPWSIEPDNLAWIDYVTGLDCEMKRNNSHAWCGYVSFNSLSAMNDMPSHHGRMEGLDVHGGVTFNDYNPILNLWTVGFDCAHADDLLPAMDQRHWGNSTTKYRDVAYVKQQVESLALQVLSLLGRTPVHVERRHRHEDRKAYSVRQLTT